MSDMHPDVARAVALDSLARTADRRGLVAMYYPGRVLATTAPVYQGDYVRVAAWGRAGECRFVDFRVDPISAQWFAPSRDGNWKRGRLFVYANQPEDTIRFTASLDRMLAECDP